MIEIADITAEVGTLTTYVGTGVAVIVGAYGVRYAFKAGWNVLKAALGITASSAKGR